MEVRELASQSVPFNDVSSSVIGKSGVADWSLRNVLSVELNVVDVDSVASVAGEAQFKAGVGLEGTNVEMLSEEPQVRCGMHGL